VGVEDDLARAELREDTRALVALVVGLGLLGTGVAYILYDVVVERLGAVTAASSTYIPPVVALVICWLVAGEPITWLDGVAVLLVLTGVIALRQRGGARRAEVAVRPA
jgi:drug/metabolite transporter (DMT)-like permease